MLNTLGCGFNEISSLDLSSNTLLEIIDLFNNLLTTLDVSQNVLLEVLSFSNNQLTNLDISNNLNLRNLYCYNNQLTNLELSQNLNLRDLRCYNNQLTSLDLSQNNILHKLKCYNNSLTSLNIQNGNNVNVTGFNALNNPNLTCIFVDNIAYSQANWTDIDPNAHFVETQEQCNAVSSINDNTINLKIYPNPTKAYLNITTNSISSIKIYNILGRLMLQQDKYSNKINLKQLPIGIYILKIKANNQIVTKKIIKV